MSDTRLAFPTHLLHRTPKSNKPQF